MTNPYQTTDRPDVGESNGLVNGQAYHAERGNARKVSWNTPGLKVTRLRLLSDPGYHSWDVSYCHGMIGDEHVDVELPFSDLPKRGWKAAIIEEAKRDGVFAKGLGILDNVSTLC